MELSHESAEVAPAEYRKLARSDATVEQRREETLKNVEFFVTNRALEPRGNGTAGFHVQHIGLTRTNNEFSLLAREC